MMLSRKNIFITGAAGLLGRSIARELAKKGHNLALVDINCQALDQLANELTALNLGKILPIKADLADSELINEAIETARSTFSYLDGAVHSAYPKPQSWGGTLEKISDEDLFFSLNKQLGGAILLSKCIINHFLENQGGCLIHLSSIQGIRAPKFEHYLDTKMHSPVEYSAIKAGIIAVTKWLARYYQNNNIRVNCVSPGGIFNNQDPKFLSKYRADCSNIGMLNPEHISACVGFLMSDEAYAINGQNLIVDDGWSL